jgi:quercetin dioxygenase-like cupin family protein
MLLSLLGSATAQTNQQQSSPVQNSQTISIIRNGSLPSQKGAAEYFTGSVRVDPLIQAIAPSRLSGGSVTFEPGARTAWHTHPVGQTLIVTAGVGRVQIWGGPVEEIRTGDVVRILPNVKHWHGASPTVAMTHIALLEQLDGKSVEWMEKVSDEQYGAAPGAAQQPTPTQTQQPAPNINTAELMRVPENAPPQRTPPRGPYSVEVFTDPGLPTHTIYEPKAPATSRRKFPVVAWGNGAALTTIEAPATSSQRSHPTGSSSSHLARRNRPSAARRRAP